MLRPPTYGGAGTGLRLHPPEAVPCNERPCHGNKMAARALRFFSHFVLKRSIIIISDLIKTQGRHSSSIMDSSLQARQSQQGQQQQAQISRRSPEVARQSHYLTRIQIRRIIYTILRRHLLRHLPARGLTKDQRTKLCRHCGILESLMYWRATSLDKYQDLSTLGRRMAALGRVACTMQGRREARWSGLGQTAATATFTEARLMPGRLNGFR